MGVSRRSLITSAVAGSAVAAIPAVGTAQARLRPPLPARRATSSARSPSAIRAGSPASATVRRSTAGGTGPPNWGASPSPRNNGTLRAWPDMRDYTHEVPDGVREPRQRPAGHPVLVATTSRR